MEPRVSVAVITYNMAEYLSPLLDSILKQKVDFPYEIIIDDDHSPDQSREILLAYQQKHPEIIRLSLRDHNVGGSRNMYGVLRQCSGDYIAILEGDDWWEDEAKLQYQFDFMEAHPQYIGMYCNSWCELSRSGDQRRVRRDMKEPMVFGLQDFLKPHFFDRLPNSTDTAFFRNIFKLDPNDDYSVFWKAHRMVWDQSLALILYGKGEVYVDPRIVSHHRTIVEAGGKNYQSQYAVGNHTETDAFMYYQHELYMENVLRRACWRFYRVRADVFAEAVSRALRTRSPEDRQIAVKIWRQRRNKLPLLYGCMSHISASLKRKLAGRMRRT